MSKQQIRATGIVTVLKALLHCAGKPYTPYYIRGRGVLQDRVRFRADTDYIATFSDQGVTLEPFTKQWLQEISYADLIKTINEQYAD